MSENLFQRKGIWYARFKGPGYDYRPSLRTRSEAEAKRKLRTIREQIEHKRFAGEERHSWKQAVVEWSAAMAGAIKASVLDRYTTSIGKVRGIMDDLYVDEVGTKTIAKIVRERRAEGVTNATINRDLTAVSSVLRYCCAQGWRDDNPAKAYDRAVTRERRDPIVLPAAEDIDVVVGQAKGNFAMLIRHAQFTGMRQTEAATLEWPQIRDRAADLSRTKTDSPRSVTLDDRAWGTLEGTPRHIAAKWVFWHQDGDRVSRYHQVSGNFAQLVRRLHKEKMISRKFTFHHLRHWFAVDYLRRGGNIYDLQLELGHSSIKTTELYLKFLTPEEAHRAKYGAQKGHNSAGL